MNTTTDDIKRLRKISGQPIMDCKNALLKATTFDDAFDILRKTATEKIDERRKDKITSEGRVIIKHSDTKNNAFREMVMISLLCETDFTAKSEVFINALDEIADIHLTSNPFGHIAVKTIINKIKSQTGEKIQLGTAHVLSHNGVGIMSEYVHFDNKKAAIVSLEAKTHPPELLKLGKQIAMHIVASKPQFNCEANVDWSSVDLDIPEHLQNKPPEILAKISQGKKKKFMSERVLLHQPFCINDKITVEEAINKIRRQHMMEITISCFYHIEIG